MVDDKHLEILQGMCNDYSEPKLVVRQQFDIIIYPEDIRLMCLPGMWINDDCIDVFAKQCDAFFAIKDGININYR